MIVKAIVIPLALAGIVSLSYPAKDHPLSKKLPGHFLTDKEKILKDANEKVMIGAAVNTNLLQSNEAYKELVKKEYNSLTAENTMKMGYLQPEEGKFNFSNQVIEELALHSGKKRIHGHTLIWYRSLPQWVKNWETQTLPAGMTRAQKMDSIMSKHITTVIGHYDSPSSIYKDDNGKPLLKSWDVVNEVFDDNGNYRSAPVPADSENQGSVWYRTIGKAFVQNAFTYARKAAEKNGDTELKLFYNDYGHDYSAKKLDAIYKMVMALKEIKVNGKPIIDGIGMQFHINVNTSVANVRNALIKMKSTGLLIHISELDISLNKPGLPFSEATLAVQKQKYKDIAMLYRKYVPEGQRWGITLWNVGDGDSWLNKKGAAQQDAPCLFDMSYVRKPAFYFFYDGLQMGIPSGL